MRATVKVSGGLACGCLACQFGGTGGLISPVWGIISDGQSNCLHPARGEVGTDPNVRYFFDSNGTADNSGGAWVDMRGNTANSGGYDYTVARVLRAAGVDLRFYINLTAGSTHYNEWSSVYAEPGALEGHQLLTSLGTALSLLPAQQVALGISARPIRWIHIRNQGTTDARTNNLQYLTGLPLGTVVGPYTVTEGTSHVGWAAGSQYWFNDIVAALNAAGLAGSTMAKFAVQSYTGMTGQFFPPTTQRQQVVYVGGTPDADPMLVGSHPSLIMGEVSTAYDPADGVHHIAGPATIESVLYPGGGYHWMGQTRVAPALLSYINP